MLNRKYWIFGFVVMFVWGISGITNYYSPNRMGSDWYSDVPFQEGMSFTTWGAHSFNSTEANLEFQKMKEAGVDWVCVNMWYFQTNLTSTDIHFHAWSDTYENMTNAFLYAQSLGMHILYKPMLNLEVYEWRSYINYSADWMAAYTEWLLENAVAAEAGGVEIFSIGCEMGNMQVHSQDVRSMIASIREVYSGLLTYSANHDSFTHIDWWDAVDIIGTSMYSPFTMDLDPTVDELTNVWNGMYTKLEAMSVEWNRPILFTEIGAQALDGANILPNDDRLSDEKDQEELRDIYLSLFQSRIWTAPWFKGAYWWIWDFTVGDENSVGFNPSIPIVLNVIKDTYVPEHIGVPSNYVFRYLLPMILALLGFLFFFLKIYSRDMHYVNVSTERSKASSENVQTSESNKKFESINLNQDTFQIGIIFGIVLFLTFTRLTEGFYFIINSAISYSIILGISTTGIIFSFLCILIVAGLISFALFLKHPQLMLPTIILTIWGYIFGTFGVFTNGILIKIFFDLMVFFLVVGIFLSHIFRLKHNLMNINNAQDRLVKLIFHILIISLGSLVLLMLMLIYFEEMTIGFLIVPLLWLEIRSNANLDVNLAETQTEIVRESVENEDLLKSTNFPNILSSGLLLGASLLIGVIVPLGFTGYNLLSMKETLLAWMLLPALSGMIFVLATLLVLQKAKPKNYFASTILNKLFYHPMELGYQIIGFLGVFGTLNFWFNWSDVFWGILSALLLLSFEIALLYLLINKISKENFARTMLYLLLLFIFLALGFIINAAKGLIVVQFTFLDFIDGAFITRTDFTGMAELNLPYRVKAIIGVIISIFAGLFWIVSRMRIKKQ